MLFNISSEFNLDWYFMKLNQIYFICLIIVFQIFYFQIHKLDVKKTDSCLKIFKSNNFLGLLIFISLLFGKI